MKKRVIIVASGRIHPDEFTDITKDDFVIGVDHAAYALLQNGTIPDLAIGDFDSATSHEREIIVNRSRVAERFPPDKDATDLELAIDYAISIDPAFVVILGAFGSRMDHTLVAIHLLEKLLKNAIPASVQNENNDCSLVGSSRVFSKEGKYRYLSILPVTDSVSVSISGCKYPLDHYNMRRGTSRGISNEIVSETATISVHKGIALVVRSRD